MGCSGCGFGNRGFSHPCDSQLPRGERECCQKALPELEKLREEPWDVRAPLWNLGAASPPPSPLPASSFADRIQRLFLGLLQLFPLKTPGISAERRENAAEAIHTHSCSSPGWISRQKEQESRQKNNQEKPIFGIGFIFAPGGAPAFQEVLMEQEKKLGLGFPPC